MERFPKWLIIAGFLVSPNVFAETYVGKSNDGLGTCEVEILSVESGKASFRVKLEGPGGSSETVYDMERSMPLFSPGTFWTMSAEKQSSGTLEKIAYVNLSPDEEIRRQEGIGFFIRHDFVRKSGMVYPVRYLVECSKLQSQTAPVRAPVEAEEPAIPSGSAL